jgi:hypothetical protein
VKILPAPVETPTAPRVFVAQALRNRDKCNRRAESPENPLPPLPDRQDPPRGRVDRGACHPFFTSLLRSLETADLESDLVKLGQQFRGLRLAGVGLRAQVENATRLQLAVFDLIQSRKTLPVRHHQQLGL